MAQVKWRCPKCRRVFEVSAGSEPIMCDDCQSAPVQSKAARAVQAGVPVQQATAPAAARGVDIPLTLQLASASGLVIQVCGVIVIIAGISTLVNAADEVRAFGWWQIGIGLSAINVAAVPAGLQWIGTLLCQRGP